MIASQRTDSGSDSTVEALRQASLQLANWVGPDGTTALLTRALSRAAQRHPILAQLTVITHSAPTVVGVQECMLTNGSSAVTEALHATLVELFALLTRLVGVDLAAKLVEQMIAGSSTGSPDQGKAGA